MDAASQWHYTHQGSANGGFSVSSFWGLLTNPWALIQYAHNMSGAVVTGAFVMAGVGAFYLLQQKFVEHARIFVRVGVVAGIAASVWQVFPSGDLHGKYMARSQPATTAAMEGLFKSQTGAPIVILGQPDEEHQRIDNPIIANKVLSFLIYGTTTAEVQGLNAFPKDQWPTNIPLLYFSYHVMVGLGTIFAAVMALAAFLLWRRKLYASPWMLWIILLCVPLPYIANTAGWLTASRTPAPGWCMGCSAPTRDVPPMSFSAATASFTLLGYMGLYLVLGSLISVPYTARDRPRPGVCRCRVTCARARQSLTT